MVKDGEELAERLALGRRRSGSGKRVVCKVVTSTLSNWFCKCF